MANKHMVTCSMFLVIRKMEIKPTVRYHHVLTRMTMLNASKDVEQLELSYIVGGNIKWNICFEKGIAVSLKTKHTPKTNII